MFRLSTPMSISQALAFAGFSLALAACPGGDPEPAGTPVTKPAPEEPPVKAPLVVPAADDEDQDGKLEPEAPADVDSPAPTPPPEDR